MRLDAWILHGPEHERLVEAILTRLDERGVWAGGGEAPRAARVLLGLVPVEGVPELLAQGTAVLPYAGDGWLIGSEDCRADRAAEAITALLDAGASDRLRDATVLERGVHEVESLCAEFRGSSMDLVCEAISLAISRGAPIYNAGSAEGCAELYTRTARLILDRVDPEESTPLLGAVLEELKATLEGDPGAADDRAWELRRCFDRIIIARHTADALQTMDGLFVGLRSAGRASNASLVHDVVSLAISHGAPIFNAGSHVGCAQIYLRTAAGLLELLGEAQEEEGQTEVLARASLPALLDEAESRLRQRPTDYAWELRHAFDALVETAAEERSWEHDC